MYYDFQYNIDFMIINLLIINYLFINTFLNNKFICIQIVFYYLNDLN
jgi:hypothetical protein